MIFVRNWVEDVRNLASKWNFEEQSNSAGDALEFQAEYLGSLLDLVWEEAQDRDDTSTSEISSYMLEMTNWISTVRLKGNSDKKQELMVSVIGAFPSVEHDDLHKCSSTFAEDNLSTPLADLRKQVLASSQHDMIQDFRGSAGGDLEAPPIVEFSTFSASQMFDETPTRDFEVSMPLKVKSESSMLDSITTSASCLDLMMEFGKAVPSFSFAHEVFVERLTRMSFFTELNVNISGNFYQAFLQYASSNAEFDCDKSNVYEFIARPLLYHNLGASVALRIAEYLAIFHATTWFAFDPGICSEFLLFLLSMGGLHGPEQVDIHSRKVMVFVFDPGGYDLVMSGMDFIGV